MLPVTALISPQAAPLVAAKLIVSVVQRERARRAAAVVLDLGLRAAVVEKGNRARAVDLEGPGRGHQQLVLARGSDVVVAGRIGRRGKRQRAVARRGQTVVPVAGIIPVHGTTAGPGVVGAQGAEAETAADQQNAQGGEAALEAARGELGQKAAAGLELYTAANGGTGGVHKGDSNCRQFLPKWYWESAISNGGAPKDKPRHRTARGMIPGGTVHGYTRILRLWQTKYYKIYGCQITQPSFFPVACVLCRYDPWGIGSRW